MKRTLFFVVLISLIISQTAFAKEAIPSIVSLQPHSNEKNFCNTILEVELSCHSKQTFSLKLSPADNLRTEKISDPKRLGDTWDWYFSSYKNIRPKTKYTARLSSSQPFLYHGRKVREAVWTFVTAPTDWLSELGEGATYSGKRYNFLELVTDSSSNFSIEISEKKQYDIVVKLYACFNAGVNGPPMAEQEARYKRELATGRKAAIFFIKKKGYNPAKMSICWIK